MTETPDTPYPIDRETPTTGVTVDNLVQPETNSQEPNPTSTEVFLGHLPTYKTVVDPDGIKRIHSVIDLASLDHGRTKDRLMRHLAEDNDARRSEYDIRKKNAWFEEMEADARDFISQITGFPSVQSDPDSSGLPRLDLVYNALEDEGGSYSPLHEAVVMGTVRFNSKFHSEESATKIGEIIVTASTAHELAHGAVDHKGHTGIILVTPNHWAGSDYTPLLQVTTGLAKHELSARVGEQEQASRGYLFEEAWAELVTSEYLTSRGLSTAGEPVIVHTSLLSGDKVEGVLDQEVYVDSKYMRAHEGVGYYVSSSIAGHVIDVLEDCRQALGIGDKPLFELMKATRHLETRTESVREFIKVINAIKPGLYSQLSKAQYTDEDFVEMALLVQEIRKTRAPEAHNAWWVKVEEAKSRVDGSSNLTNEKEL